MPMNPLRVTFDIEISPNVTKTYDPYDARIVSILRNQFIYSFAYKWSHEKTTHVVALPDFPLYKKDKTNDIEVIKALWQMFDRAHVLVGHNVRKFDIPKVNTRFAYHKLGSPSPYVTQDTLLDARRYFSYPGGNSLSELARFHGLDAKGHMGADEWESCEQGNEKAWRYEKRYNKRDVDITEKIYLIQQPFVTSRQFNMEVLTGQRGVCPSCGSHRLLQHKTQPTKYGLRLQYKCGDCGSYTTQRKTENASDLA